MDGNFKRGFKRKTIEKVIRGNIQNWINSITNVPLKEELNNGGYVVTGGCIASMLLGETPNDFDLYFQNKELATKVANYYISNIKSENQKVSEVSVENTPTGIGLYIKSAGAIRSEDDSLKDYNYFEYNKYEKIADYFNKKEEKPDYSINLITSNAISLNGGIQLILRFTGDASTIHENFDFIHCCNYYTLENGIVLNSDALEALLTKELKYVGSKYPICSLFRIRKFLNRGFTINAGELTKIAFDISKLNMNDTNVLKDQLTGVDYAYFREVISILEKKESRDIDRTYLFELINRVFEDTVSDE